MRILAALVVVLLTLPAVAGEDVTFTTADGLKITGTLYPSGRKGAAGVVALPMYMRQRSSWEPVAAHFTKAGIDFLAIDMRGHGDSAVQDGEDLSRRAKGRDPKLFNAMWQDALAAREFLIGKGADENRIGLLGASVGCSVAIDAASRTEKIPGVCVMTPGKAYLGVNTMEDLPGYGKRPMLILSSKEEAGGGATAIQEKLGDAAEIVLYDERQVHGTLM
ncbi:MAG: alpha/beta hydrolase, partial [Planctomycetota bacterium]